MTVSTAAAMVTVTAAASFFIDSLLRYGFEALHGRAPIAIFVESLWRSYWRLKFSKAGIASVIASAAPLVTYALLQHVPCDYSTRVIVLALAYVASITAIVFAGVGPWYIYSAIPLSATVAVVLLVGNYIAQSVTGGGIDLGHYESAYVAQLEAIRHYRSLWGALLNASYVFGVLAAVSALASSLAILRYVYGDCALLECLMHSLLAAPLIDITCEICVFGLYVPPRVPQQLSYVAYAIKYLMLYVLSYYASRFVVYGGRWRSAVNVVLPTIFLVLHAALGVVGSWMRG